MNPMNWDIPHTGVNAFQAFFVPFCALLALRAILRIWSGHVPKVSGVLEVIIWSSAAMAIALPDLTSVIAKSVGIHRGADLVFYLAILGGVSACSYFYQRNRQLENVITELVRRDAVRNARFGSLPPIDEPNYPR